MKGVNSESGHDEENGEMTAGISFTEIYISQESDKLPFSGDTEAMQLGNSLVSHQSADYMESENLPGSAKEKAHEGSTEAVMNPVEYQDKLYLHLRENLDKVKAYVMEMGRKIPVPDQCVIEGKRSEPFPLRELQHHAESHHRVQANGQQRSSSAELVDGKEHYKTMLVTKCSVLKSSRTVILFLQGYSAALGYPRLP